jgi:oligosaccharide repeat unit polymerase
LTDQRIIYSNLLILISIVTYLVTYRVFFNKKVDSSIDKIKQIKNIKFTMDIFFIATLFCSLFIITHTGFSNLFSRADNSLQIQSSSFALIVSNSFRSVPVIYVAMNLCFYIKNKHFYKVLPFIIGCIFMVLVNFPTATARFWMAGVYLGLLIIVKRKFNNIHIFKIIMFIGILIIFPAINIFRINSFEEVIKSGFSIAKPTATFLAGDFDSYSMLVRSLIHVDSYGTTWGYQLLGNLLFFIPRSIWPTKPIGSGALVAEQFGWHFTNVSMPFIGEGFINFGILGVIIFSVILALMCKLGDLKYELYSLSNQSSISFVELIYPFSIGFLFFILRGDLLSSLSYYLGFMVPIIILWLLQSVKLKS